MPQKFRQPIYVPSRVRQR